MCLPDPWTRAGRGSGAVRVITVGAVLLLATASSASAECAWVLWVENSLTGPSAHMPRSWDINGSYSTRAQCESAEAGTLQQLAASARGMARTRDKDFPVDDEKVEVLSNIVSHSFFTEKGYFHFGSRLLCLPDTVDPRGPKGK